MPFDGAKVRVVVFSQKEISRDVIQESLTSIGIMDVVWEASGHKAFEVFLKAPADVVIIDEPIEGLRGVDLALRMRRDEASTNSEVHIVLCSEDCDGDLVVEAVNAGISEFIVKPFPVDLFGERLKTMIEHPRPFVRAQNYIGPERRVKKLDYLGIDRRRGESKEITKQLESGGK